MTELNKKTLKKLSQVLRATAINQLTRALRVSFPKAEIFLVGGYVRDLLLGRDTKDIDLAVHGVPTAKLEQFLRRMGKVNLVGRRFGVFKFIPKHKNIPAIDIALPRTEKAFGTGGYRDVRVRADYRLPIHEDLARRDFTMNAMAWNILEGRLIDPHFGVRDISQKIIRAVGNPGTRFREDYSRMLRALRFSCQLDFKIEPVTFAAIQKYAKRINDKRNGDFVVPRETIAKELLKSFFEDAPRAFDLYDETGMLRELIPELLDMKDCPQPKNYHSEGDVWQHTRLALQTASGPKFRKEFDFPVNAEIIMAALFHDIAKPATITMPKRRGERIRFDGHDKLGAEMTEKITERLALTSFKDEKIDIETERLAWLVRYHLLLASGHPEKWRATTIERYYLRNREQGNALLAVQFCDGSATVNPKGEPALAEYRLLRRRIRRMLRRGRGKVLPSPILNGNEIMKATGLSPGPEIGRLITLLREAQLAGKTRSRAQAISLVKKQAIYGKKT